jgi:hypothetical protein
MVLAIPLCKNAAETWFSAASLLKDMHPDTTISETIYDIDASPRWGCREHETAAPGHFAMSCEPAFLLLLGRSKPQGGGPVLSFDHSGTPSFLPINEGLNGKRSRDPLMTRLI